MSGMSQEKEWEIRRLASKVTYTILTDAGDREDAKLVAALVLNILLNPAPMPAKQQSADLIRLVIGG